MIHPKKILRFYPLFILFSALSFIPPSQASLAEDVVPPVWQTKLKTWRNGLDTRGPLPVAEAQSIVADLVTEFDGLTQQNLGLQSAVYPHSFPKPYSTTRWGASLPSHHDLRSQYSLYRVISSAFNKVARHNDLLAECSRVQTFSAETDATPASADSSALTRVREPVTAKQHPRHSFKIRSKRKGFRRI